MTTWPGLRSDFFYFISMESHLEKCGYLVDVMNLHGVSFCGCLTDIRGSLGKGRVRRFVKIGARLDGSQVFD